jgi:hypothetical protein
MYEKGKRAKGVALEDTWLLRMDPEDTSKFKWEKRRFVFPSLPLLFPFPSCADESQPKPILLYLTLHMQEGRLPALDSIWLLDDPLASEEHGRLLRRCL